MMKVEQVNYNKKVALMVYLSQQEGTDKEVQKQIEDLKKDCKEIAVFTSGDNSMEYALKAIIQERMM